MSPPRPRDINALGVGTMLFLMGPAIWPVLAGARAAAPARIGPVVAFLVTGLAYVLGVVAGVLYVSTQKGIDIGAFFFPVWAGGLAAGGCLFLLGVLDRAHWLPRTARNPWWLVALLLVASNVALNYTVAALPEIVQPIVEQQRITRPSRASFLAAEASTCLLVAVLEQRLHYGTGAEASDARGGEVLRHAARARPAAARS